MKRANDLSNQRWSDCLRCLAESVPQLKANPWLIILERLFIHDYLDSLTEILSNLSKHENDIDSVRRILQEVYEAFVEIGRFAKYQPAFSITDPGTLKRFVRLLDQVAHRGSDKALFPNVLSLLGPTFEREELYPLLAEAKIVHSLMSFVRTDWMPTPSTLALLLAIIEQLSLSSALRALFMEDSGFERLQGLAYGTIEGFTKDQQLSAQQALALFPPPRRSEEIKENDAATSAAPNNNLGSSPSPTPNNTTGNEINNNSSYNNNDNQNTQQQYSSNNYQTTNNNNNNNGSSTSATPSIQSNNNNNNNNNVSVNQPIPPSSASSHLSESVDDGLGVSEDHSGGMDGTEDHDNDITNTEDDASP